MSGVPPPNGYHFRVSELERRVAELEAETPSNAVLAVEQRQMAKTVDRIDRGQTWVIRILVGMLVTIAVSAIIVVAFQQGSGT